MPHRAEPQETPKTYGTALFAGTVATHGKVITACKIRRWKIYAPFITRTKTETLRKERLKDYE